MLSLRSQFVVSFMVFSVALLPATMRGQTFQAPQPPAGVAPAAITQAPSTKVEVTYVSSQLMIRANGAPLIEVLRAACKKISAQLDAQAQPKDPVYGTMGPGSAKEVLDSLLSDAHVNYVLGSAEKDPNAVARVTISSQTADGSLHTQAAHDAIAQAQDDSGADSQVRSGASQLLDLIESARTELASGVRLDQSTDLTESQDGTQGVDVPAMVEQLEAQLKAAGQSTSGALENSSDGNGLQSDIVNPTHRPMHRKHH